MEPKKKSRRILLWLIPLIIGTIYVLHKHNASMGFQQTRGLVFGTIYTTSYQYHEDLKLEIEKELKRLDLSLSPFNKSSIITKVNLNEDIVTDTLFQNVFRKSMQISEETHGAFDITIAPLANAWGFGFKKGEWPDSTMIDSLLLLTNYKNVSIENGKVIKKDPRMMISCSAIAKGYATDVIAQFFERKGIKNYMVDIGGEVVLKGHNPREEEWRIGINKPIDDSLSVNKQELQIILQLTDAGIATSGNYRNYYYKDGKKYAHTIDPRTGYPVQHNILSATVLAEDCMTADALATAFMVMGLDEAETYLKSHPTIGACFIYSDSTGQYKTHITENMQKYVIEQK
ncbi:FAD:protein FMN transferase [Bacteroides sp. 224]|uniref:FAD:protein FMN transferase n=1 Tax=Bacteroides sp. 224 TaxID=2302936 RepID=UPI0013D47A95|nr:FAD:protein FMN transferase [Bacteroides sp. 224]NDV65913.1 FAD:protein FMN transferase [Bacteroides sp. 224]